MPAPKRPAARKGPRKPPPSSGLPSATHSDTSAIVQTILASATPPAPPDSPPVPPPNTPAGSSLSTDTESGAPAAVPVPSGDDVSPPPQEPPATIRVVARPGETSWAPLAEFAHSPLNPRFAREYDPHADPELARFTETVEVYGILQPVAVAALDAWLQTYPEHVGEFGPDVRWVVVLGNRRLASAQAYGLDGLPFYQNDRLANRGYGREAVLIENYHRRGIDPIREAAEMRAILEDSQQSVRAFASRIGISHTQVNQRLQLLDLIPEFQGMVSDFLLPVSKALPLTSMHPEQQRELLELGPPYLPARLRAKVEPAGAEAGEELDHARITTRPVTIKRNSTPAQVAETLRAKLTPDLLAEVLDLLRQNPPAEGE